MKEFLEKLIARKREEFKKAQERSDASNDIAEVRAIGVTLAALRDEIAECEKQLEELDKPAEPTEPDGGEGRKLNPVAAMQTRTAKEDEGTSSVTYRKAFQKYLATGKMEARADETTKTTDTNVSTVIPENLVNQILEKYEQLGVIYNLVTKTAYPVGQSIPVDGVKPTATWVGRNTSTPSSSTSGEGASSDSQKKTLGAAIVFAHYKLRCEIRYTEEIATMALPAFEALFVKQVGEAMLRAQEYAIVEGDGYGMPTGILANTPDTGKAITIAEGASGAELTYGTLCECEAAIPVEKEGKAKWCMTKKTFMSFVGMVDQNGQPIARVNYGINGKPERTLLGRDVVIYVPQSGSKLKDFTPSVDADTLIAFIFDFEDYVLNTNYDLGISHARDWDNEDHKTKAVLACDGKVVDKSSLVTLTVKNAA